jgi:hypothetical protein
MVISKALESERRAFCDLRRKDRAADYLQTPVVWRACHRLIVISARQLFFQANRGVIEKLKLFSSVTHSSFFLTITFIMAKG